MRQGKTNFCTEHERRKRIAEEVNRERINSREIAVLRGSFFLSDNAVGGAEWREDVRNFVADVSDSEIELIPHATHLKLRFNRAIFVVMKNWGRSSECDLSDAVVGGVHTDGWI